MIIMFPPEGRSELPLIAEPQFRAEPDDRRTLIDVRRHGSAEQFGGIKGCVSETYALIEAFVKKPLTGIGRKTEAGAQRSRKVVSDVAAQRILSVEKAIGARNPCGNDFGPESPDQGVTETRRDRVGV